MSSPIFYFYCLNNLGNKYPLQANSEQWYEAKNEENMWHSQFSQNENFLQMFCPQSPLSFSSPVLFMISNPERIKCYFSDKWRCGVEIICFKKNDSKLDLFC